MNKRGPIFDFEGHRVRTIIMIVVLVLAGFLILGFMSIKGWEYSNSTAFCATACHQVHPEEPVAFQDSYHANIKCVECHMGRTGTIRSMLLKAGHVKHLPAVIFRTYDRPLESESMRPARESCELCHNPRSLHGDNLKEIQFYLPDQANSERRRFVLIKVGGKEREKGLLDGVHWHIINPVEYIAEEEHKQEIPWVRFTRDDGTTVEYNDTAKPLSSEEIRIAEKRLMDCLDCHNRLGHPFLTPGKAVNAALADGKVSKELPFAAKELTTLLTDHYENQEEALVATEALVTQYRQSYPDLPGVTDREIQRAIDFAKETIPRLIFETPGVTWKSFPNNGGHKDFPGCFRCHDGKHVSDDGAIIPLQCTLCHGIPQTVAGGDQPPRVLAAVPLIPQSHKQRSFIFDHRMLANQDCVTCHGPLEYGQDDSSFCATSACHGESWEPLEWVTQIDHPYPLVDSHEDQLCYECHKGFIKPSDQCLDCHLAPRAHFRQDCADCHDPTTWPGSAASLVSRSTKIPHPMEGFGDCLQCHDLEGAIKPAPVNHRNYNAGQCTLCHKVAAGV